MQGKGTVIVVQGSFGAGKVHFRVLDSELFIVWSLDWALLWVLPVRNCIRKSGNNRAITTKNIKIYIVASITAHKSFEKDDANHEQKKCTYVSGKGNCTSLNT